MPAWLANILGVVYQRIPFGWRPPLKRTFLWTMLRLQAVTSRRPVRHGRRVEFLDFEIAHLEPYEFLGPADQEVLVDAQASCVSPGTERAVLMGLPGARRRFPYVPGYSVVGRVREAGKGVGDVAIGDIVAGRMPHSSAGIMKTNSLFKVPAGISYDQASFLELGIITLQGIRKAGIRPGDRVAVVGQGLIGQLAVRLARVAGADPIVAIAASRKRMGPALRPGGANEFLSLSQDRAAVERLQADIVIEAVGSARAITVAMQAARRGGRVVLLGSSRDLGRNLDWWNLAQRRELMLIGAHISALPTVDNSSGLWRYKEEGKLFLKLLASGQLDLSDLITWRPRPDECNQVFEVLAEGGREHVGIVFQWAS